MPSVLEFTGFRVVVYPGDHEPAHVHVKSAGEEALFFLGGPKGPIEIRENYGFSNRDIVRIVKGLEQNTEMLWMKWGEINDH